MDEFKEKGLAKSELRQNFLRHNTNVRQPMWLPGALELQDK